MTLPFIATAVLSLVLAQADTTSSTSQDAREDKAQVTRASETLGSTDPDEKVICRKVRTVGSNMTTRDCRTVAQRRKEREEARDSLRNNPSINNLDTGAR